MGNRAKEVRGCWVEIEAEINDIDHPMYDLKKELLGLENLLITPYLSLPHVGKKIEKYRFEMSSSLGGPNRLYNAVKQGISDRKKRLQADERGTDNVDIEIINDSLQIAGNREIISCWIASPIFDLIASSPCSLQDYHLLPYNPSEYFFMYGDENVVMDLLRSFYGKTKDTLQKLYWKFCHSPGRTRYEGLSLLEDHMFNVALGKGYFESFDKSLLGDLADEIAKITGESPNVEKLVDEELRIATKMLEQSKV